MIFWLRLDDGKQRSIGALIRKHLCIPCRGALEPRSHNEISSRVSRGIWGQVRDDSSVSDTGLGQFRMILNYEIYNG
jgi:hypothetical protein